jgi:hypothetical protein
LKKIKIVVDNRSKLNFEQTIKSIFTRPISPIIIEILDDGVPTVEFRFTKI